ncbi:cyclic nucleotide-binding domain-containing protein [Bacteriovoracaceae bacterium]|nr:cyclic nucleotide-binding domain-containing protein [Bacteriovoracaceae bacterium]|tara:strand:+ start:96846 stop:97193 length:348 start_codon:yes stop_codon:yes gene_type:complete
MADTITLKPEEYLMREGEDSNEMYFLNSGTMAVYKVKNNTEVQIGTIYSGELVGEMSFLDSEPRSATVKAIGECELVVIPNEKLNKYLSAQPKWYRALVQTLLDRLRRTSSRVKI